MIRFDCLKARYDAEGEPENLHAAGLDAIEWLTFFERQGYLLRMPDAYKPEENQKRLRDCIGRLKEYLDAEELKNSAPPLAQTP